MYGAEDRFLRRLYQAWHVTTKSSGDESRSVLKVNGKESDDYGGIIQFYEKLAKLQIRK
jgi:hypothetical protein